MLGVGGPGAGGGDASEISVRENRAIPTIHFFWKSQKPGDFENLSFCSLFDGILLMNCQCLASFSK